jgi:hypothetical protein
MSRPSLNQCTFIDGSNISGWSQTINITSFNVVHKGSGIWNSSFNYTRLCDISAHEINGKPNPDNINGCCWFVRKYEGVWYCGTYDYLRVCQKEKEFHTAPAYKMMPKKGDDVGLVISTINRSYNGTVVGSTTYRERSNIYWLPDGWPEDSIASAGGADGTLPTIFGYDIAFDGPPPESFLPMVGGARDIFGYAARSIKEHKDSIANNIEIPPIPDPVLPEFPPAPDIDYSDFMNNKNGEFDIENDSYLPTGSDKIILPTTIELPEISD